MRSGGRWLVVISLLFVSVLFAAANSEQGRVLLGRWSFTKSVVVKTTGQDRGYYYRFKASLAYKGEPLDFDIVVGCNVSVTTYKDNDRTVEVGVAPMVYGLKMKDGRGVVVRPPEACRGETTENGKVPAALLPLFVTYENADQPWFGLAYASEDAYASPISELKFFGATISKATREEWQEWRRTEAPRNFITYELLGINEKNRFDHPHWKPGFRAMSSDCTGFSWVRLPESVREAIRPYWPASKSRYWYPSEDARRVFYSAGDFHLGKVLFEGYPLREYFPTVEAIHGVSRHKPGGLVVYTNHVGGDVYPAKSDLSLDRLDDAGEPPAEVKVKSRKSYAEATVDPKLKGFAYCDVVDGIDGEPSSIGVLQPLANRVNGEPISDELTRVGTNFDYAFERDESVIFYKRYVMVSILFGGL
jgi:hypothetical protein